MCSFFDLSRYFGASAEERMNSIEQRIEALFGD